MIDPGKYAELVDGRLAEPADELPGLLEDPSDGTPLGRQRATSAAAVETALEVAVAAWEEGEWSQIALEERAAALERFAAALEPRAEEIALVDAIDSGVPISVVRLFAESLAGSVRAVVEAAREAGDSRRLEAGGRRVELLRLPWGPAALLTPWNAPAGATIGKLASALVAGCPTILKPSEHAPSFAQAFAEAAIEAELPSGALQIVHGDAAVAGKLVADDRVRVIALTGGQATGRIVAATAATRMVALQLELGGTNAAIVADDADVAATAEALARGMTKLNGQWCEAPRQVMVAERLHDELLEALLETLGRWRVGPPLDEATDLGPLAHRRHFELVREQISALGGRSLAPTPIPTGGGFFLSPTVVVGVAAADAASEVFGPVLTLHPVAGDREAIELANRNGDGLAGYVFSEDLDRAFALGRRLHAGEVRVGGTNLFELAPGSTQSFWGTTGIGDDGVDQVLEAFRGSRIVGEENPALPA